MIDEVSKINLGLLKKNVFLRDTLPAKDLNTKSCDKKYFELQRNVVANGIVEELVSVDYPINEKFVSSHLISSDYKRDPLSAQLMPKRGKNLGDITNAQEVLRLDTVVAKDLISKLNTYLEKQNNIENNVQGEETVSNSSNGDLNV